MVLSHHEYLWVSQKPQWWAQGGGRGKQSCSVAAWCSVTKTLDKTLVKLHFRNHGPETKQFHGVFNHLTSFIWLRMRAGEATGNVAVDNSEVRDYIKLWSLLLTQCFQLQNSGQILGYCCHIHLGGDNHGREDRKFTRGILHTSSFSQPIS